LLSKLGGKEMADTGLGGLARGEENMFFSKSCILVKIPQQQQQKALKAFKPKSFYLIPKYSD